MVLGLRRGPEQTEVRRPQLAWDVATSKVGHSVTRQGHDSCPLWLALHERYSEHLWWTTAQGTDVVRGMDSGPRLWGFTTLPHYSLCDFR